MENPKYSAPSQQRMHSMPCQWDDDARYETKRHIEEMAETTGYTLEYSEVGISLRSYDGELQLLNVTAAEIHHFLNGYWQARHDARQGYVPPAARVPA